MDYLPDPQIFSVFVALQSEGLFTSLPVKFFNAYGSCGSVAFDILGVLEDVKELYRHSGALQQNPNNAF